MTWERVVDPLSPSCGVNDPILVCFAPLLVSTKGGFALQYPCLMDPQTKEKDYFQKKG